jgi:cytochrome c biogenesis protein CcmG, thiol:disulfide interchange protein DsbE
MRFKLPLNAIILISLCCVIAVLTFLFSNHRPPYSEKKPIADFSYTDIHDKKGSLYQAKNQTIVLHFWATWCLPCIDELPLLLKKASASPDTFFILISADLKAENITQFLKSYTKDIQKNVVVIHDPHLQITTGHFGISQFPETLILNQDKSVKEHLSGIVPWDTITF